MTREISLAGSQTMQSQALFTLEFDRLKELLLQQARTPLGAAMAESLTISVSEAEIVHELRLTSEGAVYLREGATALDVNDLPDPRPALGKLNVADVNLEPFEILNLLRLISVAMGLRAHPRNHRNDPQFALALSTIARPHFAKRRDRGFRQPGAARSPVPDFKAALANPAFTRKHSKARRRGACVAGRIRHYPQRTIRHSYSQR
jgi:hypothetical protein